MKTPSTAAATPRKPAGAAPPRIIVRIELTLEAKRRSAAVADKFGMTQISATSRLVEWFAVQSETVQAAVLGQYPQEIEADVARLILGRMREKQDASRKA
jgi:hypothetical protein